MYKIKFSVGGRWITEPLTQEILNKVMNNFTEKTLYLKLIVQHQNSPDIAPLDFYLFGKLKKNFEVIMFDSRIHKKFNIKGRIIIRF